MESSPPRSKTSPSEPESPSTKKVIFYVWDEDNQIFHGTYINPDPAMTVDEFLSRHVNTNGNWCIDWLHKTKMKQARIELEKIIQEVKQTRI